MTKVEFTQDELQSLAGLIVAGAKSPHTGAEAVVQAGDLLKKLQTAADASANTEPVKQVQAEIANGPNQN